ncbi:hypothetical protein FACS1894188_00060 [Clostridia bacterium]|nr:hypothetical protein FACS1894188_00060 [Clostridia bacterium]
MENLAYEYRDERPYEVLNGVIYSMATPTTSHNRISFNIARKFGNFLEGKKCEVYHEGTSVFFPDDEQVIPDVLVVCDKGIIEENGIHGAPDLVVEVLSPSTAKRDKGYKKNLYEKHGVKEYWIVNPIDLSVEVYLLHEGKLELDNIYRIYPEKELKYMDEKERAEIITEFTTSLYGDDLIIKVSDIFS